MTTKYAIRIFSLSVLLLFSACEKLNEKSIFTQLSIRLVMPDSRPVERLEIRSELSYFNNINTYERILFPAVEQNTASIKLRKGVYTLMFEAQVTYSTGEKKYLRCADYNQNMQAVTWVDDQESIVLLLKSVN